ncbi:MAG: HAMP domain-containing histidine kinase [Sphingobacteriaceae bacterium]|nr:MAG: HAMP domain-containing histidine kinase [Sphingobacteriaceae bacterium]
MNWSKLIYTKPDAEKLEKSISVIRIFSIFGIVNFLIFYVLWNLINDQENSSEFLRITSLILLCILYILSFFYKRIPYILTLLWYFTVMYCLPFFGTYMLMKNINSISWLTNIILGIFWLTLIIDWAAFIIILPLGILLGILAYRIVDRPINIDLSVLDDVVSNYLWSIVIAVIFSRKKELVEKENQVKKFTILNKSLEKALLAKTEFLNNMSHEVRTPIQGVVNISEGLVDMWDKYKEDERLFFAKKVAEYSRRLISLVSNLLDLSKFNVGKMTFTMDEADLVTLIKRRYSKRSYKAQGQRLRLAEQGSGLLYAEA